jgi:nitrite reductase (NADH) small subunit/3-phenylpropionate/trans-cinnamate dioxygenase ferredoxin subunit
MSKFVPVARLSEIPPGTGRTVEVNGVRIALFNVDGTFYAVDNTCPHAGGPLGEGKLKEAIVECPWHGWRFDVRTGQREHNPSFEVPCCRVHVEDGQILLALPPTLG